MKKTILYILLLLPVLAYNQSGGAYHFPKKTTAQRDALTGMIAGEMILNTTTNTIEYYTGSAWAAFGGGTTNIDTVTKVSRIANYAGTGKAIIVTDSLEGGLFTLSPKVVGANNALFYKDGNARQFARVYDGPLNLWWFGAKPNNTGDLTTAINAAIAASTSTQSSPFGAVDNLYLPSGTYRVASDLILEKAVSIKGVIGENNSNVIVNMNGNKIVIEHNTTSASGTTADATELANIKFVGDGTDTCIVAHANFTYRNIRATNFNVGIATIADLSQGTGNANHWEAHDVQIADCTIGWLVEGDDANHGAAYKLNVIRCDTAIYDRSLLGNSYYTPHTASNGYAFYTTGAQNRSHFHDIYAEGSEGVGKEQWVSINHPSRGNVTTIGNGAQLIGTGYIELPYSQGMGLHYSKNQYYNNVFNLELGGQTGGTRAFEFRGLTDTDPGMTWQYQNGSYVLGHRGFDTRRGMVIAGDATTLTNQHGTARAGGSVVFPWGIWTGGGTLTGNNAARILGNTDTTGIVSPVNGDVMFNSNPTGLGGVPFYYRKGGKWINPFAQVVGLQDADADTKIEVEQTTDDDNIVFTTFGTERMRIFPSGNVQVIGAAGLTDQGSDFFVRQLNTTETGAEFMLQRGDADAFKINSTTDLNYLNVNTTTNSEEITFFDAANSMLGTLRNNGRIMTAGSGASPARTAANLRFLNTATSQESNIVFDDSNNLLFKDVLNNDVATFAASQFAVNRFYKRDTETITTASPAASTKSFIYLDIAGGSTSPNFSLVPDGAEIVFLNKNATTTTINAPAGFTWATGAPSLAQYESINVKVDGTVLRQF